VIPQPFFVNQRAELPRPRPLETVQPAKHQTDLHQPKSVFHVTGMPCERPRVAEVDLVRSARRNLRAPYSPSSYPLADLIFFMRSSARRHLFSQEAQANPAEQEQNEVAGVRLTTSRAFLGATIFKFEPALMI